MRRALLILCAIGFTVFAAIFVATYTSPLSVEKAAREVVRLEVERRVGYRVEVLSNSSIITLAQKALGRTDLEIEQAKNALSEEVPQRVANGVADMLNADCECRKKLTSLAVRTQEERVSSLSQVRERLTDLIESTYASVRESLLRELRIFSGTNAFAFAALAFVTWLRRAAALQLLLPAVVLVGAALLTASVYLFNQNWLHTVLYSDYVGLAYLGYFAAAAAGLADVIFNKARACTKLFNLAASVVGATLKAVPC
jgi:hypothetical protein